MPIEWRDDVGYDGSRVVAYINRPRGENVLHVRVHGGKPEDGYYLSNWVGPLHGNVFGAAKKLAETTYRLIKNQPDETSAEAAVRAYARMKGDRWWDER